MALYVPGLFHCNVYLINSISVLNSRAVCTSMPGLDLLRVLPCSYCCKKFHVNEKNTMWPQQSPQCLLSISMILSCVEVLELQILMCIFMHVWNCNFGKD